MRNNLTPTVTVDKNGRVTTVHKRNGAPVPSVNKLANLKPSISSAKPTPKKAVTKVAFGCTQKFNGAKFVNVNRGYFLDRAGVADQAMALMKTTNEAEVPEDVLYDYLRLGIDPAQAGVLHVLSNGDLDSLKNDPEFAMALPGDLGKQRVWGAQGEHEKSISGVVEFLADAGIKPQKIAAALQNNLSDDMLEKNVLSPSELADAFNRFTYAISKDETKGTTNSRTLDAFVDGRLPYSIADKKAGISRPVASHVLEAIYPRSRKEKTLMSEEDRSQLATDPEMIHTVAKVISAHQITNGDSVQHAYQAIREFGEETALKFNPLMLTARHSDGSVLGPNGASRAMEVVDQLKQESDNNKDIHVWHGGRQCTAYNLSTGVSIKLDLSDLSELRGKGLSVEKVIDMTYGSGIDSGRALAIHSGQTVAAVSEGWL